MDNGATKMVKIDVTSVYDSVSGSDELHMSCTAAAYFNFNDPGNQNSVRTVDVPDLWTNGYNGNATVNVNLGEYDAQAAYFYREY